MSWITALHVAGTPCSLHRRWVLVKQQEQSRAVAFLWVKLPRSARLVLRPWSAYPLMAMTMLGFVILPPCFSWEACGSQMWAEVNICFQTNVTWWALLFPNGAPSSAPVFRSYFLHVDISEQTTCFNNFNLDKFLSHKKTDIQRVRERLKHEDKFGRVIKIKFNKKFQKLQYASCLCLHEWF